MSISKDEHEFYLAADRIISGRNKPTLVTRLRQLYAPDYIGQFLFALRKVEFYSSSNTLLSKVRLIYYKYQLRNLGIRLGFSIPPGVFGPGLYIPHYGTIVVNKNAKVGANCVLHTCTCIAGDEPKIIGDNVYISTGAIIAGSTNIADSTRIGANSFVNKSVMTPNTLIAGSPATFVRQSQPWFEIDGQRFQERIDRINQLKKQSL